MSESGKAIFPDFGKLVPGFDFLQNLTRQASSAASNGMPKMPNVGSWVAPTLNVEELDRRIEELKAVQFWLDQNATALKATIQALEVQKMTLSALQGMNVNMADMAKAFRMPDASDKGSASGLNSGMAAATDLANTMAANMASSFKGMVGMPAQAGDAANRAGSSAANNADKAHHHFAGLEVPETGFMRREHEREQAQQGAQGAQGVPNGQGAPANSGDQQAALDAGDEAAQADAGMAAVIDPLQWWGALTQQFQTIANSAMQDVAQRKPFDAGQTLAQEAMRTANETLAKSASNARELMTGALRTGSNRSTGASAPPKSARKAAGTRSAKAEAKAETKPARGTKAKATGTVRKSSTAGGRSAPQAKARNSTPAARKTSSRAR